MVAGDAIKRDAGARASPRSVAAWLGPTKLARAILFATITNIVAYLPFLMLTGDIGRFLHSLPIVLTSSLVASRIVSMTFIPLLGFGLLEARQAGDAHRGAPQQRLHRLVLALVSAAIHRRWAVLGASTARPRRGRRPHDQAKTQFFPKDLSYLSYVDVWLPEDATLSATNEATVEAERVIREVADEYGKHHKHPRRPRSLTSFVGGGGPRFWFSVEPEQQQLNYAQLVVQVTDKHDTKELVGPLQTALTARVPGARIDVRQLETGKPVGNPGLDPDLGRGHRHAAEDRRPGGRRAPGRSPRRPRPRRLGPSGPEAHIAIDADRANLSGVSRPRRGSLLPTARLRNSGGRLREGDHQIPIVPRLRLEDRARLADLANVYVFSASSAQSVPLRQVARLAHELAPRRSSGATRSARSPSPRSRSPTICRPRC